MRNSNIKVIDAGRFSTPYGEFETSKMGLVVFQQVDCLLIYFIAAVGWSRKSILIYLFLSFVNKLVSCSQYFKLRKMNTLRHEEIDVFNV